MCELPQEPQHTQQVINRPRVLLTVEAESLDDDLLIYNPQDGGAYMINATGAAIWALCDGTRTEAEIAAELAAAYAIDYQRSLSTVQSFLSSMAEAALLSSR